MNDAAPIFSLANWKLTLPVDAAGGIIGRALDVRDASTFRHPAFFYEGSDGGMIFHAPVKGAKTPNTEKSRCELREMHFSTEAAWTLAEGGSLTGVLAMRQVPLQKDGKPAKVCIGQIHGKSDELVRLYYEDGSLNFHNDLAGPMNRELIFPLLDREGKAPKIDLGERFKYYIHARHDALNVVASVKGHLYTSTSTINEIWQSDELFFKAGLYNGVNVDAGSGASEAEFYGLDVTHGK